MFRTPHLSTSSIRLPPAPSLSAQFPSSFMSQASQGQASQGGTHSSQGSRQLSSSSPGPSPQRPRLPHNRPPSTARSPAHTYDRERPVSQHRSPVPTFQSSQSPAQGGRTQGGARRGQNVKASFVAHMSPVRGQSPQRQRQQQQQQQMKSSDPKFGYSPFKSPSRPDASLLLGRQSGGGSIRRGRSP